MVNARFADGSPSNDLAAAGVLVSSFDLETTHRADEPWRTAQTKSCLSSSGRVSASLIRRGFSNVWSVGQGGFIVNPRLATVRCAYARDGHSCRTESGCDPWCASGRRDWFGCAFVPEKISEMLLEQVQSFASVANEHQTFGQWQVLGAQQNRYNEVVLAADAWTASMPSVVEAIFFHERSSDGHKEAARQVHQRFLSAYPELGGERSVPLLSYEAERQPPFQPAG